MSSLIYHFTKYIQLKPNVYFLYGILYLSQNISLKMKFSIGCSKIWQSFRLRGCMIDATQNNKVNLWWALFCSRFRYQDIRLNQTWRSKHCFFQLSNNETCNHWSRVLNFVYRKFYLSPWRLSKGRKTDYCQKNKTKQKQCWGNLNKRTWYISLFQR